jgi:hypothetical protein
VWGNLILDRRTEYGRAAQKNRGNYSGQKVHRLHCEYIVGVVDESAELNLPYQSIGKRFLKESKPVLFSCSPACGCTSGQNAGRPIQDATEQNITCEKCKRV